MGKRRRARESAIQCLYQWEVTGADPELILQGYWESHGRVDADLKRFAESLVLGTVAHADEIDAMISEQSRHWRLDRLGLVEKSILRLGGYELIYEDETPAAVVIDEAVELSKRFADPEAGPFINGLLDGMSKRVRA
ncbi:MAG: transcription antitermination factor NusB [Acidobacteria bacterium]|nr:transcription antitermination factor NusB [Acidobacteriota bacterium]